MTTGSVGVEPFGKGFGGELIRPGDSAYDERRRVWNGDIDRRPALIARCATAQHVAEAIYLDALTDDVVDIVAEQLPRKASPLSFVPVFPLGGAYARVDDDATAFGGSRTARFAFNVTAICPAPELLPAERAWVRSFWESLRPHASGSGSYVNFMAEIEVDR